MEYKNQKLSAVDKKYKNSINIYLIYLTLIKLILGDLNNEFSDTKYFIHNYYNSL